MSRRPDRCFVYFVRRADGCGPVKIGCSEYPESRLSTLMAWAPYPLAIIATTPGDESLEKRFHALFISHHSHREWFHWAPAISDAVERIRAGTFDFQALPAGRRVGHPGNFKITPETRQRIGFQSGMYHVLRRTGFTPPADVRQMVDTLDKVSAAEREAAIVAIRTFIAAPHLRGSPAPWPIYEPIRSAYLASLTREAA